MGKAAQSINLLFGPPRSGTSFIQKVLSYRGIGIYEPTGQNAFNEPKNNVSPYLSIFSATYDIRLHSHIKNNPNQPVFVKDIPDSHVLGFLKNHSQTLQSWIGEKNIKNAKTLWIFRNPLKTWQSIKTQGWDKTNYNLTQFIQFFKTCTKLYLEMKQENPSITTLIIYDLLMDDPQKHFKMLYDFFNIPFSRELITKSETKKEYYARVYHTPDVKGFIESNNIHSSLHSKSFIPKAGPVLSIREQAQINKELMPVFENLTKLNTCPSKNFSTQTLKTDVIRHNRLIANIN